MARPRSKAVATIGTPVRRREDYRFLTGGGTYTDDIDRPGQLYAYILRSPHAHARIAGIDTTTAQRAPGVVAVYTGKDMAADGVGGLPCGWQIHSKDGSPMAEPPHPVLAVDRVRYVGDQVAVVIAETLAQARDAAELLNVDYAEEPAAIDPVATLQPGAPQVNSEAPGNLCYDWHLGDLAAVEVAFAKSTRIIKLDLVNNRLVPNAMEPRAAIGEFNRATGEYTLYTTSQNPHVIRLLMGAFVLHIPEARLRVVAPDVGGGFGSKIYHYAEEAIVTWAAGKVHRPIKWTAERSESFMSDAHGRDHVTHVELALDGQAKFLGLKVSTIANMGAYLSTFAPSIPTYLYGTLLAGTYTTPAIYVETKAVFTHTVPVDAYRGAGRPEATFLLERIVDLAADEIGMDPVELRGRNFIPKDAYPYQTPVALQYDSGDYRATLELALKAADYQGFEARRREAMARGKLRGIGIATYIEACGIAPSAVAGALGARAGLYESAELRVHPTGSVSVLTGSHSHGQGHETTFAQLVSDELGIPMDDVEIVHGDTGRIPFGMGTYGSRSGAVGGTAIHMSIEKLKAKGRRLAAHLLEASPEDIEFKNGRFSVKGAPDRGKAFAEVSLAAYLAHSMPAGMEPGLEETTFYDPSNFTFPFGTHIAVVEVDIATGQTQLLRYVAVDDVGNVINPMIVDGQLHGGIAQGAAQALWEWATYDDS